MGDKPIKDLKVGGGSNVNKVAGALVKFLSEGVDITLTAIGAGAVNQMVKSLIVARGMAAVGGTDLYFVPGFVEQPTPQGEIKTAVRIFVKVSK